MANPTPPFLALPAEVHEMIFDHVLADPYKFRRSDIMVSRQYRSRALRSYYKHGNIKVLGTQAGLSSFQALPHDLRKTITRITLWISDPAEVLPDPDSRRRFHWVEDGQYTYYGTDREADNRALSEMLEIVIGQSSMLRHLNLQNLEPGRDKYRITFNLRYNYLYDIKEWKENVRDASEGPIGRNDRADLALYLIRRTYSYQPRTWRETRYLEYLRNGWR